MEDSTTHPILSMLLTRTTSEPRLETLKRKACRNVVFFFSPVWGSYNTGDARAAKALVSANSEQIPP